MGYEVPEVWVKRGSTVTFLSCARVSGAFKVNFIFETYLPDFACGKNKHVTDQTQNFSLYYVAIDIVTKE